MLFLTARTRPRTRSAASRSAATTTWQKPFSLDELVARTEAVLRRTSDGPAPRPMYECADLRDGRRRPPRVRAGADVSLSPTEYNLLRYLLVNQGRVLSKAQILDHVWKYDFGGDGGVVETYIGYLRAQARPRRAEADPHDPRRRLHAAPP